MKIFIDTANIDEIKKYSEYGFIDGVTTNPALIAKEGQDFKHIVQEICALVDGPISAEVISTDVQNMIKEARLISKLHKNIIVKLPATDNGFKALNVVAKEGIKVNFTIIYTANQALLAGKLGATYVSPFIGRLDVGSTDGTKLIKEIRTIYDNYKFDTQILAASMRNAIYVKEAAIAGADIATIPPSSLDQMIQCEFTELGLQGFLAEWDKMSNEKKNYFNETPTHA
jgi:transaldolase